jgi:hypothetical protein
LKERLFLYVLTFLCAVTASFSCPAQSTDETVGFTESVEEVSVLGTRLSSPGPEPAEVINSEQIVATQAATVAELMRFLPGITGIEPGGVGGVTEIYIRGADANFTTVFVNGVLMNDPTDTRGGGFDFSSISPVEINRIDVVRGPFSALYGSGALAGAINIDTRAPATDNLGGLFQATLGSDGYWQLGGGVYGPVAKGHAGLNANYVDFGWVLFMTPNTVPMKNFFPLRRPLPKESTRRVKTLEAFFYLKMTHTRAPLRAFMATCGSQMELLGILRSVRVFPAKAGPVESRKMG